MGQFFIQNFRKDFLRAARKPNFRQAAFQLARREFEERKVKQLLTFFDIHPVTLELQSGANDPLGTPNLSKTLGQIGAELGGSPNLYTFLGFNEGDDPTDRVRERIDKITRITITNPIVAYRGRFLTYKFRVIVPTLDDFAGIAPMPS